MQNKPHAPTDGQNGEPAAGSKKRETERQRGRQRAGTKSGERSGTEQRGRHPLPREPREQIRNRLQEIKNLGRAIPENCTGIRSGQTDPGKNLHTFPRGREIRGRLPRGTDQRAGRASREPPAREPDTAGRSRSRSGRQMRKNLHGEELESRGTDAAERSRRTGRTPTAAAPPKTGATRHADPGTVQRVGNPGREPPQKPVNTEKNERQQAKYILCFSCICDIIDTRKTINTQHQKQAREGAKNGKCGEDCKVYF